MFRCCSLETSHPRLLPQSPKVCPKNMEHFTNLHVIRSGHASLLCVVPVLVYVLPKRAPLQYSCLENPIDRGAWQATVHGVAKSWTRLLPGLVKKILQLLQIW